VNVVDAPLNLLVFASSVQTREDRSGCSDASGKNHGMFVYHKSSYHLNSVTLFLNHIPNSLRKLHPRIIVYIPNTICIQYIDG
jgi:hypothetical protein